MDLLIILTYTAICVAIFKIFRIPLNKWSVPTAILGGIVVLSTLLFLMNYNHPYSKYSREVFISVPIIPVVRGLVVSVDVQPNEPVKQGDVLFRIDAEPFEAAVAQKRAALREAEQLVLQQEAAWKTAKARTSQAEAERDRSKASYERFEKSAARGGQVAISELELENRRQLYLSAEAALEAAKADEERNRLIYESQIDGVNTRVAQLRAELQTAEYELDHAVVRAPSDGVVTQLLLQPGMMVVPAPLRPTMVFIPDQARYIAASFWQNSLQRIKPGFAAEMIVEAVPGHIFKGKVKAVAPAMGEGELQATGALISSDWLMRSGRGIATIELDESLDDYDLPRGVQGQVAVYSDSFTHVAVMRQILLRMAGWMNYIFPVK